MAVLSALWGAKPDMVVEERGGGKMKLGIVLGGSDYYTAQIPPADHI
jgi:hypothetical protein